MAYSLLLLDIRVVFWLKIQMVAMRLFYCTFIWFIQGSYLEIYIYIQHRLLIKGNIAYEKWPN